MDFDNIYKEYSKRIFRFVNLKINNIEEAEDITVTVFEKIYINLDKYDKEKATLETWIFSIVRNEIVNYYRKNKKIEIIPIEEVKESQSNEKTPHESLEDKELKEEINLLLSNLTEKEKKIIEYKYGGGLNNNDISEILEISSSNVGVTLFRAMKKLQGIMGGKHEKKEHKLS